MGWKHTEIFHNDDPKPIVISYWFIETSNRIVIDRSSHTIPFGTTKKREKQFVCANT